MTETEPETTDTPANLPKINPFVIPGWEQAPAWALCPWKWPSHENLYIEVDNYAKSLKTFRDQFANPALLRDASRLVVVAGDTGTGKSALRNYCAHLLAKALTAVGLRAEIIDVTRPNERAASHETIIDIPKRMSYTCEQLIEHLANSNLIDEPTEKRLGGLIDRPSRLYSALPGALDNKGNTDVVLFLLLPTTDLEPEVQQYATMTGGRIVYFAEAELVKSKAERIATIREAELPPIALTVGSLNQGDARRFVDKRFTLNEERGQFPGLHDEVIAQFDPPNEYSIATLQAILARMYRQAMLDDENYVRGYTISLQDAEKYTSALHSGGPS